MKRTKPAIFQGQELPDYRVDTDGNIWSSKRGDFRMMNPHVPNQKLAKVKYPSVTLQILSSRRTFKVHRIVAETLIKIPLPNGFRKSTWKRLNDAERRLIMQLMEVNHIDHDATNYHPSNLEWVTRFENLQKSYSHYYSR
jgi:hypothetical protein